MSSDIAGQVKVGPFAFGDLPDKDASIIHIETHWSPYLADSERRLLMNIWMRTTRFGNKSAKVNKYEFEEGMPPNPSLNFAGIPRLPMSKTTYYRAMQVLVEIGIIRKAGDDLAIDYSVIATDIAKHDVIQKRVMMQTKRDDSGPMDADDVLEYVQSVMWHNSHSNGTEHSHMAGKKFPSDGTPNNIIDLTTPARTRVSAAGYETVDDMRAALKVKTDRVRAKRLKRGNATDHGKLFQAAWHAAMKERFPKLPRTPWNEERVVSRVKRQIVRPALDAGVNVEELARFIVLHWFAIRSKHLKWAKEYPDHPVINFVLARTDDYMTAFATHDGDIDGEEVEANADTVKKLQRQLAETQDKLGKAEKKAVEVIQQQAAEIRKLKKRRPVLRNGPVSGVLPSYDERIKGDKK